MVCEVSVMWMVCGGWCVDQFTGCMKLQCIVSFSGFIHCKGLM